MLNALSSRTDPMASIIKEGLICAECHAEFNSVAVLLSHYQNTHSPEEAKSIKGILELFFLILSFIRKGGRRQKGDRTKFFFNESILR